MGLGLNSNEINLLKLISIHDKVQGIDPAEIQFRYNGFEDFDLNYICNTIKKLNSIGLVKSASNIKAI